MLTRHFLLLLSFSFLFQFVGFTQELTIGLMPIRVKFIKEERRVKLKFPTRGNIMKQYEHMYKNEGIPLYNEMYYPLLEEELINTLKKADIAVTALKLNSLDEADLEKEEELFNLLFPLLGFGPEKALITYAKDHQEGVSNSERIAKLTKYFGGKLDKDFLVFFTFKGHHYPTRREEKNETFPEYAKGNIGVQFFIVEVVSGKILKSIDNTDLIQKSTAGKIIEGLASDPNYYHRERKIRTRISQNNIKTGMRKFARKLKRRLKKN